MAEAKFKLGDRVRVLDGEGIIDYTGHFVKEMKEYSGKEYVVEGILEYPKGRLGYCLDGTDGFRFDERGLESAEKQTIVIYRDGKETIGLLKYNGNTVNRAVARCCPQDRYDFKTGAEIVLDRLFEPEVQKYNARLVCVKGNVGNFSIGKIYEVKDGFLYCGDKKFGSNYHDTIPFKSLDEINKIMFHDFIELKED